MRFAFVIPLLLLVGASPTTRPTTKPAQGFIAQVRHVEYAPNPNQAALEFSEARKIPADAKEVSSLQVLTASKVPFETVAVVNGMRYSFSGTLYSSTPSSDGKEYVRLEFDYRETNVADPGSIMQVKSNIMLVPGESVEIGGLMRDSIVIGLVLTVKPPDAEPQR